jgi:hypothetical protein
MIPAEIIRKLPISAVEDYDYYRKCVNKFNNLLKNNDHKLFIMMFTNNSNINENFIN